MEDNSIGPKECEHCGQLQKLSLTEYYCDCTSEKHSAIPINDPYGLKQQIRDLDEKLGKIRHKTVQTYGTCAIRAKWTK